jgi:hypothetical protein
MKKSPHKISTMITTASTTVRQKRATKRWREREKRIGARERGKAQDPEPQKRLGGTENESNEKIPVEQKASDPLGERTIAGPPAPPF